MSLLPNLIAMSTLCAAGVSVSHPAFAQQRIAVSDPKQLLVAAIDAPDGRAHGVFTGTLADAITRRFNGTSPIHIDVRTEKRYAQTGCRRLVITFSQDGVHLPDQASARRQTIDIGLNYCRDGSPPASLKEAP